MQHADAQRVELRELNFARFSLLVGEFPVRWTFLFWLGTIGIAMLQR